MRKSALFIASTAAILSQAAIAEALDTKKLLSDAHASFQPLPSVPVAKDSLQAVRADLGRRLFFENRVSMDGNVSCSHCHLPDKQATDGLPKAVGVFGKENPRNAPSIFNAAMNFKQHWRGDRESLEEQAEKSLLGPASFGNPDQATAMGKLKAIPAYADAFTKAFPDDKDPINSRNWGIAVAAFEWTLLTPSRFDAFLSGDAKALSPQEQAGLRKFIDTGCATCHNGVGLGGNSFQKFGVTEDYWKETGSKTPDKGRADVTKNDDDLYVFKVPSLRNVAKTAPYFHDGSVDDLTKAVKIMGKTQLDKTLSDKDTADIVAFLGSLTGPVPANYSAPEPYPDAK
ncbi:c-type cytochrome [Methylocystis sp. MJC1]|jgi:cytochrome c peroxidase|uniref:cytochrome-c peroxidase n=1 Tax=Methylocystis sp. MJC1 TaxID=2654282 RepID=UPI0013EB7C81|nr:cytochrome c peroxidase [Methylocystis sp. MJC1]KAF2990897.1 Cytochrome c551 peroxidase [Methylocystis sp. MJC1]MBU6527791.1 c-type cytochrome [Methylocystis sp. MJC1]UZX10720.1 c-type cytochrome [Methylocystis sp. MJC1]